MKKAIVSFLKISIGFGIAGFLIWFSFHDLTEEDLNDIKSALLGARFWLILVVFAILLFSHWIRSLRWKQMIVPMHYNPPVFDLLCGLLVGYFANQLLPRAGEIIRCTAVAKKNKIPAEKLIGTIVVERAVDLICLLVLSVATFFIEYKHISVYAKEIISAISIYFVNNTTIAIVILIAFAVLIAFVIDFMRKRSANKNGFFWKMLTGLKEGLLSIKKVKNKWLYFFYTIIIWLCYIVSTWIGCFALEQTAHLSFSSSIALLVFGTFGIIVAPGGLGAYPIAIQKTLVLYGLSANIGMAAGWLLWTAQFAFNIIFGTIAYLFLAFNNKKKHEEYGVYST